MNVLVCGASGFIGRHVVARLRGAGHSVDEGRAPEMDFARDVDVETWLRRLQGVEAVVNSVGVLRDTRARPMEAVHHLAPAALFRACARRGVRVLHVSAQGIDENPTRYAITKLAAETELEQLRVADGLAATVLRPSIVFGRGGASSELFMRLARLPVLVLPGAALSACVQPVAVDDLAAVCVRLLQDTAPPSRLDCVGPRALPLAGLVASLRAQLGRRPAGLLPLPDWLSRASARCGDLVPFQPWCSETLSLLQQDNVGDAAAFERWLGRPAVAPGQLVAGAWRGAD